MGMTNAYQQTDAGLIPTDWSAVRLSDIGEALIGLTYRPADVGTDGVLVLRSSNVQNGMLCFDDNVYVNADVPERIMVREGDILICVRNGSRDLIGKSALIDKRAMGMTFGAFMAVFRTESSGFIHQQFKSDLIQRQIREHLGATINQITNKSLNSFVAALPTTKREREVIAKALSDADALIESLEQLLAKKRQIKQGAMQELLTCKKRLPGFGGNWQEVAFSDIASTRAQRVDPQRSGIQDFCIELEHIESATGVLKGATVTGPKSSLKSVFQPGDVLFGKLRAYLRKYWLANRHGVCSTEIWCLTPKGALKSSALLFQLVQTDAFIEAASMSYGTHMPRSDWNAVKGFVLQVPLDELEQTAIATALSDMDAELTSLETKLAKARQLKQGMMQELLTGRIRLV